jgi:hypothetical protein
MDVLQHQVDEYENEIRALKDFKSPKRAGPSNRTPRRSATSVSDTSIQGAGSFDDVNASNFVLEATLFRPALQKALHEAARWKATATASAIMELPHLPIPANRRVTSGESKFSERDQTSEDLAQLALALSSYRLEQASISMVDLTRRDKTPRVQLRELNARKVASSGRLEEVLSRCRRHVFV